MGHVRNTGLDLVRLLAVVLVIGRHMSLPPGSGWVPVAVQTGGWVGVDLFFVLSGFLISGLLFREYSGSGGIRTGRFLARRGFKIYPSFYVMLIATVAVRLASSQPVPLRGFLAEFFFVQNYLGGLWDHTWSLAVEEHFYLGIAAMFGLLLHRGRGKADPFSGIPLIFLVMAAACQSARLLNLLEGLDYTHTRYLFATHLRIDSLMFGVLLSYLSHYRSLGRLTGRIPSPVLLATGAALLAPAFMFPLERYELVSVAGVVAFYLGSGAVIIAAVRLRNAPCRLVRVLGSVGAASYSIYLWHMPVMDWGWRLAWALFRTESYLIYACICLAGSIAVGMAMNKIVEWPMLKVRERFLPSPRAVGALPEQVFTAGAYGMAPAPDPAP